MFNKIITSIALIATVLAFLGIHGCIDQKETVKNLEQQVLVANRKVIAAAEREKQHEELEKSKQEREKAFETIKDKEPNHIWLSTTIPMDIDNTIPK